MKKIFLTLLALAGCTIQYAQQPLSLEAAMEMAAKHNYDLKNQALNIAIVDNDLAKIRARRMPGISGTGEGRYNPILQTVVIPGDAFGQPGDGPQKVQFGTNFSLLFSVEANYKVLDPAYQTNVEINRAQNGLEAAALRKNTLDLKLDAATAYFEVALQQSQEKLAAERLKRTEDLLAVAQTRLYAGAVLPVDIQKSELDVQNAQSLLDQAENNLQRSRLNLSRLLGIPAEDLILETDLLQIINADTAIQAPVVNTASIDGRDEIREEQQRLQINQLQMQLQDRLYMPAVEVFGNVSAQHLSDDLAVWRRWFPFAFVGLRATLPIYDGNLKARNKETYQYQMQISSNNLARLREDLSFELHSTALDLNNALSQLSNAGRNLATARRVLQTEQTRYREGELPFADFRNTEFSLREAESNLLSAIQNYLVSRLRWMRASR